MSDFKVLSNLKYNGTTYPKGETINLNTDEEKEAKLAKQLVADGVLGGDNTDKTPKKEDDKENSQDENDNSNDDEDSIDDDKNKDDVASDQDDQSDSAKDYSEMNEDELIPILETARIDFNGMNKEQMIEALNIFHEQMKDQNDKEEESDGENL